MKEEGLFETETFNIQILSPKPEILPIPTQSVHVGTTFTYQIQATDPNNDIVEYFADSTSLTNTINVDSTGLITYQPSVYDIDPTGIINDTSNYDDATHQIQVRVTDSSGNIATTDFNLIIYNNPPVINSIPNQKIKYTDVFTYQTNAYDPDGDSIIYSIKLENSVEYGFDYDYGEPYGPDISIDSTGLIIFRPIYDEIDYLNTVTVTVKDLFDATNFTTFNIDVVQLDLYPIYNQFIEVNKTFTYQTTVTKSNNILNLNYSISSSEINDSTSLESISIDSTGKITIIPTLNESNKTYMVTVKVEDADDPNIYDQQSFQVSVMDSNFLAFSFDSSDLYKVIVREDITNDWYSGLMNIQNQKVDLYRKLNKNIKNHDIISIIGFKYPYLYYVSRENLPGSKKYIKKLDVTTNNITNIISDNIYFLPKIAFYDSSSDNFFYIRQDTSSFGNYKVYLYKSSDFTTEELLYISDNNELDKNKYIPTVFVTNLYIFLITLDYDDQSITYIYKIDKNTNNLIQKYSIDSFSNGSIYVDEDYIYSFARSFENVTVKKYDFDMNLLLSNTFIINHKQHLPIAIFSDQNDNYLYVIDDTMYYKVDKNTLTFIESYGDIGIHNDDQFARLFNHVSNWPYYVSYDAVKEIVYVYENTFSRPTLKYIIKNNENYEFLNDSITYFNIFQIDNIIYVFSRTYYLIMIHVFDSEFNLLYKQNRFVNEPNIIRDYIGVNYVDGYFILYCWMYDYTSYDYRVIKMNTDLEIIYYNSIDAFAVHSNVDSSGNLYIVIRNTSGGDSIIKKYDPINFNLIDTITLSHPLSPHTYTASHITIREPDFYITDPQGYISFNDFNTLNETFSINLNTNSLVFTWYEINEDNSNQYILFEYYGNKKVLDYINKNIYTINSIIKYTNGGFPQSIIAEMYSGIVPILTYTTTDTILKLYNLPEELITDTNGNIQYNLTSYYNGTNSLTYTLLSGPPEVSVSSSGLLTITSPIINTYYNFTVQVSDGTVSDERAFRVFVK
ncbi:MAG: hypothetical protein KatS3mg002_0372 [Candidatus Woesearchaeota archaeon]|nr:MAG: hypothetical protein KatS3mg002_0372 [Candidatus Woesearchaeota archaeon]